MPYAFPELKRVSNFMSGPPEIESLVRSLPNFENPLPKNVSFWLEGPHNSTWRLPTTGQKR